MVLEEKLEENFCMLRTKETRRQSVKFHNEKKLYAPPPLTMRAVTHPELREDLREEMVEMWNTPNRQRGAAHKLKTRHFQKEIATVGLGWIWIKRAGPWARTSAINNVQVCGSWGSGGKDKKSELSEVKKTLRGLFSEKKGGKGIERWGRNRSHLATTTQQSQSRGGQT